MRAKKTEWTYFDLLNYNGIQVGYKVIDKKLKFFVRGIDKSLHHLYLKEARSEAIDEYNRTHSITQIDNDLNLISS